MLHKLVIGALGAMAVMFSSTAFAQGTATEAKAMLEKVVAGMKADKNATLAQISKGEFKDRDLYPYCVGREDCRSELCVSASRR